MNPHITRSFASIGRAVWLCQVFETSIAPIYEFFKMKNQPGYLERTQGFIAETTYKNPLRNIIKELSTRTQIDPEIETRLDRYIEDRHLLVHRWFIHYGWPDDDDLEQWTSLQDHADRVGNEAQELTRYFAGYIVRFAETEWAKQNPDEYDAKISGLFQVAGSG